MITKLYSVRDTTANYFGPVLQSRNDELAQRMYLHALSENPNINPNEMGLFCIGEFDDENGNIIAYEPRYISIAVRFHADDLTEVK